MVDDPLFVITASLNLLPSFHRLILTSTGSKSRSLLPRALLDLFLERRVVVEEVEEDLEVGEEWGEDDG